MLPCLGRLRVFCAQILKNILILLFQFGRRPRCGWRKTAADKKRFHRNQPKPAWVRQEVIRLKALMPEAGCRMIAGIFNRRFAEGRQMTVSKTFVNGVFRKHNYEIQVLRKKIKNGKPKNVPRNLVWGVDLTGKTDGRGNLNQILGIVEHKSRTSLSLRVLADKTSIAILRALLDAVEHYGKPKFLRTDNESVFTSQLFRFGLWLMGIRPQRTDKACPWQNGRIERFFGTLKGKLDQWIVSDRDQLSGTLDQFRFWYNHVRPHQNLDGRTLTEVWRGIDIFTKRHKDEFWFEAWDGLLTGIYLKL